MKLFLPSRARFFGSRALSDGLAGRFGRRAELLPKLPKLTVLRHSGDAILIGARFVFAEPDSDQRLICIASPKLKAPRIRAKRSCDRGRSSRQHAARCPEHRSDDQYGF